MGIDILEQCQVRPSKGAASVQNLPLFYSDIIFLDSPLLETLIFYSLKCSESHFLNTIVPNLKNSLSLSLKHFLPLAGNILFPLSTPMLPLSRYQNGDSVSLTVATSNADFAQITGNQPRKCDQFYDLIAQMPPPTYSRHVIKLAVTAIQLTLFPNQGICVGFTNHHAIGDGATILGWLQSWASGQKLQPCSYDRSSIHNAHQLTALYWNAMRRCTPTVTSSHSSPSHKVRQTFVLGEAEIKKLKNLALRTRPHMVRVSSLVAVCAYMWSCAAKSSAGEEVADNEPEYFCCGAENRAKSSPPLPATYFGNCVALVLAESTHSQLCGDEGFVNAVEAIRQVINNDRRVDSLEEKKKLLGKRVFPVVGFPKYDVYGVDFGWGKPQKYELITTDYSNGPVFLCKSREGGVEFGLSMPKPKMDAFAAVFNQGLREATPDHVCIITSNL